MLLFSLNYRSSLGTTLTTVEDLMPELAVQLTKLLEHDFIARKQSEYIKDLEQRLLPGCVLVKGDFSQNYSVCIQDAVQSHYWSTDQITVHPWVYYYRDEPSSELKHCSLVMISDYLKHDVNTVATFQAHLVNSIRTQVPQLKKMIYFTDGAGSQYKNKMNFYNTCLHEHDHGVEAEWHFYASYHGKGPCDGVGGTFKRSATRASLQRPVNDQITNAKELYDWARANLSNISTIFVSKDEILEMQRKLNPRFAIPKGISGTRDYHCYIPSSTGSMTVKTFSSSNQHEIFKLADDLLSLESVQFEVIIVYEEKWWVGFIVDKYYEVDEFSASLMEPSGPSTSYRYPTLPKIVTASFETIIHEVTNLKRSKFKTYTIPKRTQTAICHKFLDYQQMNDL